jgi:hypothetical protein
MERDHGSQDALIYAAQQYVIAALQSTSDPDLAGRLERCTRAQAEGKRRD